MTRGTDTNGMTKGTDTNGRYVTVEQFVYVIAFRYRLDCDGEDIWTHGRKNGWLEEQDFLWKDRFIERRNAARIVHEFLRIECGEQDEDDWKDAKKLTDLYDCKVCAKHVAQVYIKKIMPAKEEKRFQLLTKITEEEMVEIINRMVDINKRR